MQALKKFPPSPYPFLGSCYAQNGEMKQENMDTAISHNLVELFGFRDYVHVKLVEI